MARDLTAGMVTHFTGANTEPVILMKGAFDSGDVALWTGVGNITFDGDVYTGSGDLVTFTVPEETAETRAEGGTFILSGVDASLLSVALSEEYQGRSAKMWLGAMSGGALITSPYLMFDALMDVMTITQGGDTIDIRLTIESRLIRLQRARKRLYTKEDQQQRYSGDTFFDFQNALQDKEIILG